MLFPFPLPPQSDVPVTLPEMIVTAPRSQLPITTSGAKVTVVTGEELQATGERSLPRAIGQASGVWMQESNLGGGAPVIRGLLGNQILILLDGVRVNNSATRFGPNQSLNTIEPAIVDRVEIIRGSRSVLYGSDAIGGVVAIWTKRRAPAGTGEMGGDAEFHAGVEAKFDSATSGGRGAIDVSGATETLGLLGIVGGANWNDLRAGGGDTQEQTGYRSDSAFGSLDLALGEDRSLRVMTAVHRDHDVPRTFQVVAGFGQTEPSFQTYDFALQERDMAVVTYDHENVGSLADRLQVRLSARRYKEQRDRQRTGSSTFVSGETTVDTLGLGLDLTKSLGENHFLTFGFDADHDSVDSFNQRTNTGTGATVTAAGDFAPGARYDSFGAFVQDEISTFAPTYFTAGLRYSYFDFGFDNASGGRETGSFDALTASLEAAHDLSDEVTLTATLAQGFQAPNLEDLANDGDFSNGIELANPDLDPARSLMGEVGAEVRRASWSGALAVFWTSIDDYIGRRLIDVGDPAISGDEVYLRSNAGEVRLWGVEGSGRTALGGARSEYSLETVASWVRGRQYDDTPDPMTGEMPLDGVEVRRIPPLHGRIGVRWDDAGGPRRIDHAGLWLDWATAQRQLNPDDVTDPRIDPTGTDGWAVVSFNVSGQLASGVQWSATLGNLLDKNYRVHGSGFDAPGRSIVLGIRASF
ncbi:Colicin I receptor precursor [Planctomycetes bacterium Poly30]|uniref:Colicin I receptor n=1 Tax=Saltatorellus ferox TaxID=2528018 RepID=A0A518EP64_9BACT|nr:Colicin I receptor precursor [Planctomycetes bacterium Poly30]